MIAMKLFHALPFSLAAGLVLLPMVTTADEIAPDSRIVSVTVYRQRALVTREAHLSLPAGTHRVVFRDLPPLVDPDSLRVAGTGPAGLEIGEVEIRQVFRQPTLTPEYRQVEAELKDLADQQVLLNDRRGSIQSLHEFLASLKSNAGQESPREVLTRGFAVESWQKAFDFFSTRLDKLASEARLLNDRQKGLNEKMAVARRKLSQVSSQAGIQRWNATVLLAAPRGGWVTLAVSYLTDNVSWTPLYDIRLDPDSEQVSISWRAQMTQNTGEDWKRVTVHLSSTRPSAGIDLPKLASAHLRAGANGTRAGFSADFLEGLPILGTDYQDVLALAPGVSNTDGDSNPNIHGARDTDVLTLRDGLSAMPARTAQADVERREVAVTFALPGTHDIPSDGQPHKNLITTRTMEARIEYQAIPPMIDAVYLVAKINLAGDIPLLPGKAQHFLGSNLVGTSQIGQTVAGGELSLSFGPDDRLKAERKQLQRRVHRKGRDDETDYRFVTTIENHLGRDASIRLSDRIPVSMDERISVTLDEEGTTGGFLTDSNEPGILTWIVSVPGGTKREVSLLYQVRWPRGVSVPGLD